mgnify:CR=1 FL=1
MTAEYIVIKIGGVASKQLTPEILTKLSEWQQAGQKIVIVHGGGFAINQLMRESYSNSQGQWSSCDGSVRYGLDQRSFG